MIGVLVATHGNLGKELIATSNLIFGEVDQIESVGLNHGDSVEGLKERIIEAVKRLDQGEGILILTDLYGGSPTNMAAMAMNELGGTHTIECIVGTNLPILLEVLSMRKTMELNHLVDHCMELAENSVINLREKINF
ncbi:PTS sugar transporter subunit IIA [Enterococcus pallens]|uniref:PTS system, mannose/fructose/sorbose family, IIA component n=1 Tax=Enterococcus pallens ATCC BAA-351 TaxID=1158607 RepID=R2PZX6_9ENTE|nr:PTS sugar transporter subunit IIA [Enterococcus pallens]EOH88678.1 PTS system, mannose/fructose/sorbose family, IIA component [Enterococcus pallens ATCC BAA-351]EOU17859.1 hypothetical protein I588_02847 [Enterococcus pallens ATCC BAA-351]OJG82518.1 PTS system, mannose/fructose/sorbose family, IIA component [Enterococcus pallens]